MDVLAKAAALVAIIGIGQLIKRAGWVSRDDFGLFAKLVLRITLPCALVTSFNSAEMPLAMLGLAAIGFAVNLVLQLVSVAVTARQGRREQAFAVLNVPSFNMGAFATPYIGSFMGPGAMVQASLFDVGNALGAAGLGYAWGTGLASEHRTTPKVFLRAMLSSVVFDVYLALVAMKLLHLHLPSQVIDFTQTVGQANTFLAMLMIGIGLEIRLDRARYRLAARYLGLRYAVVALLAVGLWLTPLSHGTRVLLVMVLFAPIASMSPGFTHEVDGDVTLSTFMASASIIVAVVALPVLLAVLG